MDDPRELAPGFSLPYVGSTWSLPDRVQVATGFAKWGMTNGTAAGRLLAADVLGQAFDWAAVFDAGRLGPVRSLAKVVKLNGPAVDDLRPVDDDVPEPSDQG